MPTSSYMPDVKVEIAFNAGFATAAASRTWTDVSAYVELAEGISIQCGRSDERTSADANHLTLVLDNSDGRFTPGKTGGAYYPNVKLDRPIRVLATPVDGAQSTRFLGSIDEWAQEWDGTDGYAKVTVSASSRLARLGLQAGLKSIIQETILADGPAAYYTLGEPAGATQANDSSGAGADPLALTGDSTLPVVFGNAVGPGTDGLTAAEFAGGQFLSGAVAGAGSAGSYSLEAFFLRDGIPATNEGILGTLQLGAGEGIIVYIEASTGHLVCAGKPLLPTPPTLVSSSSSVADGATHHVAVTRSGSTLTVYLDGASVGTVAVTGTFIPAELSVGTSDVFGSLTPLTGVVAHAALFPSVLTSTQVGLHASAGLTGFAGELTSARLVRYAALGGVPSAEVSSETGQTTMTHVDITDKQVVDLLRVVETAEGGVLFDGRDGTLTMQNRLHRYTASSIYTLTMSGEQEVEAGYTPKLDRAGLMNDITGKNVDGTVTARAFDDAASEENGHATGAVETASDDPNQPADMAWWLLNQFKTPRERTPTLPVNALAQVGKTPNCAAVMATTIGDKVTVAGRPSQASSASIDYFVEGWSEVYGPESLTFTFNVSPSAPYDQVLIIDDATRGVIDTNVIGL